MTILGWIGAVYLVVAALSLLMLRLMAYLDRRQERQASNEAPAANNSDVAKSAEVDPLPVNDAAALADAATRDNLTSRLNGVTPKHASNLRPMPTDQAREQHRI